MASLRRSCLVACCFRVCCSALFSLAATLLASFVTCASNVTFIGKIVRVRHIHLPVMQKQAVQLCMAIDVPLPDRAIAVGHWGATFHTPWRREARPYHEGRTDEGNCVQQLQPAHAIE